MNRDMKIHLADVSPDGEDYEFTRGEHKILDDILSDLFKPSWAYHTKFRILPMGTVFQVTGQLNYDFEGDCSLCGDEMLNKYSFKMNEYLVKEESRSAPGHSPRSGLDVNETRSVTFYESDKFDLKEFIHEQFASVHPDYPKCQEEEACKVRQESQLEKLKEVSLDGHPSFQSLKDIKKNH